MHIALVYDAVYPFVAGGVERRNYAVAKALRREHRVALYGFHYWADGTEDCLPGCRYISVGRPLPLYAADGRRRISEAIVFGGRLLLALFRSEEEVWDVANFPFFSVPAAWLASRLRRRKLIVTWHEFWGRYWYRYLGWRGICGQLIEKMALACSPRIIAVSDYTRRRLIAAGYPPDDIRVVPNGVDVRGIARVLPFTEASELVYVGRLLPHKRVDLAIEALAIVRRQLPTVTLAVIGEGPERARLQQLAARLGVESAVRFVGALATSGEVYARLKSGKVLIMPSEREGFGISVIEAWACGLPAVVCQGTESALPDLIDDDTKGRVVAASAEAVAVGCADLLARPPEQFRSHLLAAAADYDWVRIAARLESVYSEIVSECK